MFCTLFYYVGLVTVVYLLALLVKFGLRQFHGTPKSNPIFKELKAGSGAWAGTPLLTHSLVVIVVHA